MGLTQWTRYIVGSCLAISIQALACFFNLFHRQAWPISISFKRGEERLIYSAREPAQCQFIQAERDIFKP